MPSEFFTSVPDAFYDRLAQLASIICNTSVSTIFVLDKSRSRFESFIGLEDQAVQHATAFCMHTIRSSSPVIVKDTLGDPIFRENPLVAGPPYLRFFAGIPLIAHDGAAIGALAVMDRKARRLSNDKTAALKMLAALLVAHIELQEQQNQLARTLTTRDGLIHQLQQQIEHLIEAQRIAKIGSWELALPFRRLNMSDECARILGTMPNKEAADLNAFMAIVHQNDYDTVRHAIESAIDSASAMNITHRMVRPGGEIRYLHQRGEMRIGFSGRKSLSCTVQDITEQRKEHEKLVLLDTCISRVNDIVMITEAEPLDEPGPPIVFINRAFERRTGYLIEEVLGKSPRFLQGPKTQRAELDKVRNSLRRKEHVSAELINYSKSGAEFWIEIDIDPVAITGNKISHFVAIQRDITQRKASERQIERLAFFDPLTQLPNRRLLMDRLNHALATAVRRKNRGALLFIDLDNFKGINDTLGHDKGDQLLEQVARRLEGAVRKSNTIARVGGDEFVVLLEDLSSDAREAVAQAEVVAEKALASFTSLFHINGYEHHCTASIGVTLFGEKDNPDELLKRADLAMYQAKGSGRNAVRFFDHEVQSIINTRVTLDRDFRGSLKKGEFVLHYQPQVNESDDVIGAEALVRWKHPRRGLLYPTEFIALAEETGLIVHLGQWVLETACRQLAAWEKQTVAPTRKVAINVSARQFHHPDFVTNTLGIIEDTGVNPSGVKLELTESAFAEHLENTVAKMAELRSHGVRFSLDDFGTGYSSLSYLKKLPLDEIKIDRAFVQDILTDSDDAAITQTIVALCHILGFDVLAEGVETEGQRVFLAKQGCHMYQGNLISVPVPAADL